MGRIFADTNVLFPFSVMDLLLALSEDTVHELIWTDALLDEWEEVIVREQKRTAETAARLTSTIRDFFADSKIERTEYQHLVDEMPGTDADDHEHSAAAIAGGAHALLTRNVTDYPHRAARSTWPTRHRPRYLSVRIGGPVSVRGDRHHRPPRR